MRVESGTQENTKKDGCGVPAISAFLALGIFPGFLASLLNLFNSFEPRTVENRVCKFLDGISITAAKRVA
jgi:hypothetical protein